MKPALLCLLLALSAVAEPREVIEATEGVLITPDAGTRTVGPGAYLPEATLLATGRELESLRAENEALKEAPGPPPPASLAVAVVVGLVLGFVGGVALALRLR